MVMKRKQKILTGDELKEKLIAQSADFWLHSDPLCAILLENEGPKLLPLSSETEHGVIALFLLDFGDYSADRVFEILSFWRTIYKKLPWKPVIAFQQKYLFIKNPKFLERYRNIPQFLKTAIYLDPLGEWHEFYQAKDQPTLLLFHEGNLIFKEKLSPDFYKSMISAENQLQEVLRLEDPGLPLPPIQKNIPQSTIDRKMILPETLAQTGHWVQANRSLVTDDSQAALSFEFEGKHLRLLCTTHPQARENSRIQVLFNQEPLAIARHGEHVHLNDKGLSVMDINKNTGIYELISSEEALKGTVQIKFLNAHENPVILYELRTA